MNIAIHLSSEKKRLAESYAKLYSVSLEEAFKKDHFEKTEDEFDIAVAQEAYNEYVKDGKQSRPISELFQELSL